MVADADGNLFSDTETEIQITIDATGVTNNVTGVFQTGPYNNGTSFLYGTTTVKTEGGVAVFPDLALAAVGDGFKLTAKVVGLSPIPAISSPAFSITAGQCVRLQFIKMPKYTAINSPFPDEVVVSCVDAGNNTDIFAVGTVFLALDAGVASGGANPKLNGSSLACDVSQGIAKFSSLSVDALQPQV